MTGKGYDGVFIREFRNTPDKNLAIFNTDKLIINTPESISEAYHKPKADGSNPELVKAVEDLLNDKGTTTEANQPVQQDTPTGKELAAVLWKDLQEYITPKLARTELKHEGDLVTTIKIVLGDSNTS